MLWSSLAHASDRLGSTRGVAGVIEPHRHILVNFDEVAAALHVEGLERYMRDELDVEEPPEVATSGVVRDGTGEVDPTWLLAQSST